MWGEPLKRVLMLNVYLFCLFSLVATLSAYSSDSQKSVICNESSRDQLYPQLVADNAGGAITAWQDYRNGDGDIYVQKTGATGIPQWTPNGVAVCVASRDQWMPQMTEDGSGGTFIAWQDNRSGNDDIYCQRVGSSGSVAWTSGGIIICGEANNQYEPRIIGDGNAGAIIVWIDYRSGTNADVYCQRINSDGVPQWGSEGVVVCNSAEAQLSARITGDGSNGAVIAWQDFRNGSANPDIYCQRINSAGAAQWTASGVAVCNAGDKQENPQIVSDGSGGAVIVWQDNRLGNYDIYCQRMDSAGNAQWVANGLVICNAVNNQYLPQAARDAGGGFVFAWEDKKENNDDIYCQKTDSSGAVAWTVNGVAVCDETGHQNGVQIVADDSGGIVVVWEDYRRGNADIYCQKINSSGTAVWVTNGTAVCDAANSQYEPAVAKDASGAMVVVWQDYRNGNNYDIYGQKLSVAGDTQWKITDKLDSNTVVILPGQDVEIYTEDGNKIVIDVTDKTFDNPVVIDVSVVDGDHSKRGKVDNADNASKDDLKKYEGNSGYEFIAYAEDGITLLKEGDFKDTFTIRIYYRNVPPEVEPKLKIFRLDETAERWVVEPQSKVNTRENYVSLELSHLTIFRVMGFADTDVINVVAFPNPWKAGTAFENAVKFTNVTSQCSLVIYDIAGNPVYEGEYENTGGGIRWNLKNSSGADVFTGYYIYLIKTKDGKKATGKILVIR